jgi:sugar lactone lactonase YvrE
VLAQPDVERPNGVAVSQDCRTLYVVDSSTAIRENRKVWAFELDSDGRPFSQKMLIDFEHGRGGDGMGAWHRRQHLRCCGYQPAPWSS